MAIAWLQLTTVIYGRSKRDVTACARISLLKTKDEVLELEKSVENDLREIAEKVRRQKLIQTSNNNAAKSVGMKQLLIESRDKRKLLTMTKNKRTALESYIYTLDSTELNDKVIKSVKQTSTALKGLGLENAIENMDDVQIEMTEHFKDFSDLQSGLSNMINPNEVSDDELESELDMLLNNDTCSPSNLPVKKSNPSKLSTAEHVPVVDNIELDNSMEPPEEKTPAGANKNKPMVEALVASEAPKTTNVAVQEL